MKINYKKLANPSEEDLFLISKIHMELPVIWLDNYTFTDDDIYEQMNHFKNIISENRDKFFIAQYNDKIVGYLISEIMKRNPKGIYINSIWTDPQFRKNGICTTLNKMLENEARNQGILEIRTTVSIKNEPMLSLNEKLDFEKKYIDLVKDL